MFCSSICCLLVSDSGSRLLTSALRAPIASSSCFLGWLFHSWESFSLTVSFDDQSLSIKDSIEWMLLLRRSEAKWTAANPSGPLYWLTHIFSLDVSFTSYPIKFNGWVADFWARESVSLLYSSFCEPSSGLLGLLWSFSWPRFWILDSSQTTLWSVSFGIGSRLNILYDSNLDSCSNLVEWRTCPTRRDASELFLVVAAFQ